MTAWRHAKVTAIWCEDCQMRHKNGFYGCPKVKKAQRKQVETEQ